MKRRANVYQHKNMYGQFFFSLSPKDGDPDMPSNLVGEVSIPNDCEVYETAMGEVVCIRHGAECDYRVRPVKHGRGIALVQDNR